MTTRLPKLLLSVLLILSIIVPRSSAALVEMGLINAHVIVICTGDGLQTITLDADGNPVEVSEETHHCSLVHADLIGSGPTLLGPVEVSIAAVGFAQSAHVPANHLLNARFARAPPVSA